MGLMDIFRRSSQVGTNETRSSGTGYTAQVMAARHDYFAGSGNLGELTALVQSCVSLWEGGLANADVSGTPYLDRRKMALMGRSLALRGEALFLIRDTLIPAYDWDVSTRNGDPVAYQVGIQDAGTSRRETALAGEVLHVRLASSVSSPWAGTSPLQRAPISGQLLQEVETALRDVFRDAPLGSQVLPLPDSSSDDMEAMRGAFRGKRGSTLVIEGVAQATAAGMNPQIGQRAQDLSPDLAKSMATQTMAAAKGAISQSYGVLPALHNEATTGPMIREAQRHLVQFTLEPIAKLIAEEASAKLGGNVVIDVARPLQAFDTGGRARAMMAIVNAMAAAKESGVDIDKALSLVDWQNE